MQLRLAILLGLALVTAAALTVFIVALGTSNKQDSITGKREGIEWATAELERRLPD
jgi:hypothetical protein